MLIIVVVPFLIVVRPPDSKSSKVFFNATAFGIGGPVLQHSLQASKARTTCRFCKRVNKYGLKQRPFVKVAFQTSMSATLAVCYEILPSYGSRYGCE